MPRSGASSRQSRFWQRFYREEEAYDINKESGRLPPPPPPPPPPPNVHNCRMSCTVPLRKKPFNRRHSSTFPDVYSHDLAPPRRWSSVDDNKGPPYLEDLYEEIPAEKTQTCFICGDLVSRYPEVPTIHLCESGDFVVRIDNTHEEVVSEHHRGHYHSSPNPCYGQYRGPVTYSPTHVHHHPDSGSPRHVPCSKQQAGKCASQRSNREITDKLRHCEDSLTTTLQDIHTVNHKIKTDLVLSEDKSPEDEDKSENKSSENKSNFAEDILEDLNVYLKSYCDGFLTRVKEELLLCRSALTGKSAKLEEEKKSVQKEAELVKVKSKELEIQESELKDMRRQFEQERSNFYKERDTEKKDLKDQWHKLKSEIKQMEQVYQLQQNKIRLDVGGHQFVTSISTLTRDPDSMLAAMFSGRHQLKYEEDGSIFIDRDGTHFRYILNFLRDGTTSGSLPEENRVLMELKNEAMYYQLNGLCLFLEEELKKKDTDE